MRLASYDLFDTLITRVTRRPVDVFRLVGASGTVKFRWKFAGIIPFHVWRRQAERVARKKSPHEDIHLVEIYRILGWVICRPDQVMRLEIALENSLIRPIPDAVEQLRARRETGTPCCIVSDMYLSRSMLRRIVRKHIGDTPLYVSSQLRITKSSGRLFHHVATSQNVPISDIHHYGDNSVADYEVPLRLGMQASLVPVTKDLASTCMLDVLKCSQGDDPFYEMGFRLAGPSAFVMAACLAEYVEKSPPRKIAFAARDMHLVQYAFKRLSSYSSTSYLRISRSAVYRAQWHASKDPKRWFESVTSGGEFFARLGLECPPELTKLAPHQNTSQFLNALNESHFPLECENEYHTVRDYLQHEGIQPGTLLVDLGWRGSIQDAINQIIAPEDAVTGWYFGTLDKQPGKFGLYFDGSKPGGRFYRISQALPFFEYLFTEAVPSVDRIVRNGNVFEFIHTRDESPEQIASRIRLTKGARDYIDAMTSIHKIANFGSADLLKSLDELYDSYLFSPPENWVKHLEVMSHSVGFGGSVSTPLIGDDKGTPLGFLRSVWKGGYAVKHRKSSWAPILHALNNPIAFNSYELLKRASRPIKKISRHLQK